MSLSVMPPTPDSRICAETSSVPSLSSEELIASAEPCTSALISSGNLATPESLSWFIICSSEVTPVTAERSRTTRWR